MNFSSSAAAREQNEPGAAHLNSMTIISEQAAPAQNDDGEFTLVVADRCDQCGAQAFVAAAFTKAVLLFCAHHAREHAEKIADHIIADIRASLHEDASKTEARA